MSFRSKLPPRQRIMGHHVTISIDETSRRLASVLGNGNMSRGVRKALLSTALAADPNAIPHSDYDRSLGSCRKGAVHLDDVSHALAVLIGHGNVSAGIRLALRVASTGSTPPIPKP